MHTAVLALSNFDAACVNPGPGGSLVHSESILQNDPTLTLSTKFHVFIGLCAAAVKCHGTMLDVMAPYGCRIWPS